ncbi:hypothetical protein EON64_15035 [archaeon]|nr:MAG: hypothetical protein EON64_15035 [archaeon]
MKRKLDLEGLQSDSQKARIEGNQGEDVDSAVNIWTSQPFSSRYYSILDKRRQLPVYEFKQQFQEQILANQVVIVEGETGRLHCL